MPHKEHATKLIMSARNIVFSLVFSFKFTSLFNGYNTFPENFDTSFNYLSAK